MSPQPARSLAALPVALALLAPSLALAQTGDASATGPTDAAVTATTDVAPSDAGADGAGTSSSVDDEGGGCVSDPIPADHAPQVQVRLQPETPHVGDRVLVTYHFRFRTRDRVEFEPDVVAFQQPAIELDYARDQPERTTGAHSDGDGWLASDVVVAVQPFKVADVTIRPMSARFRGGEEIARFCTPAVRFRVRSVFGNSPHPAPRDITPPAEVQRDAFTLRWVMLALDALFLAVVGTLFVTAWLRARPAKPVPPPPPRHPHDVAMEGLDALARGDLLTRGLTKDYYDAISDVVRRYVGGMRGFEAIDMTTREVLSHLRPRPLQGVPMVEVERLLGECDLVKFARYVPSHEECEEVLRSAYSIVKRGRSLQVSAPAPQGAPVPASEANAARESAAATPATPTTEAAPAPESEPVANSESPVNTTAYSGGQTSDEGGASPPDEREGERRSSGEGGEGGAS